MARKRMLAPEFFTSASLNAMPLTAMVTFAGLWCYADDYGRGEDDVTMIKATVWPRRKSHTETKVAADLAALAAAGLICRYSVGGFRLLHIPSWTEHQQISHKGKEKAPPCRDHDPGLYEFYLRGDSKELAKFRRPSGGFTETLHRSAVEVSGDEGSSGDEGPRLARALLRDAAKKSA